jgi:hypothetical protein
LKYDILGIIEIQYIKQNDKFQMQGDSSKKKMQGEIHRDFMPQPMKKLDEMIHFIERPAINL